MNLEPDEPWNLQTTNPEPYTHHHKDGWQFQNAAIWQIKMIKWRWFKLDLLEDPHCTLKGLKLWPYITGTMPKPNATEIDKLVRWEEVDVQSLSTILMNIVPNFQARLDCSSVKDAWEGLLSWYAQVDPIAQNLAQTHLDKKFCGRWDGHLTNPHTWAP